MVEKICGKGEFWAWNETVNVWWMVRVVSRWKVNCPSHTTVLTLHHLHLAVSIVKGVYKHQPQTNVNIGVVVWWFFFKTDGSVSVVFFWVNLHFLLFSQFFFVMCDVTVIFKIVPAQHRISYIFLYKRINRNPNGGGGAILKHCNW